MLATMTMPGTFWFYSAVALIGAIILYFVLPETEGRTLVEIERHFVDGAPLSPATSLTPMVHIAAQTVLGTSMARFHDQIVVSRTPTDGPVDVKKLEGMRLFQKHLDEHRIRLDGHKHDHNDSARNSVVGENTQQGSEMQFTQPQWRQEKAHQQVSHVAAVSEMTHL